MKTKNKPKEFWAKAISNAVYLSKDYPSRSVKEKILLVAWSERKLDLSHLRDFGNIAYMLMFHDYSAN